ncbi:hypothetical protein AQJ43_04800 [Streptomyces avermitilis]|nr:hypothetical protein AQJ43_04800 [Streptomyces avermitilis]OOV32381.1 hypothetical protein SM007_05930 [Streptomyces avermitilis]
MWALGSRVGYSPVGVSSPVVGVPSDGAHSVREAESDPHPSLEEVAKAQHVPKGAKAVAEWWRDLDPVTRGILLQEKGDELRKAGITSPLYKWRAADEGWFRSVQHRGRHGQGSGVLGPRAGQHYLGKSGEPLVLDIDRILMDDPGPRDGTAEQELVLHRSSTREATAPR